MHACPIYFRQYKQLMGGLFIQLILYSYIQVPTYQEGRWLCGCFFFADKELMNAEAGKKQAQTHSPLVVNVPKSTPGPFPTANNSNNGRGILTIG